jgi:hypothetical protein
MEEVPLQNLKAGKEYYIESIRPKQINDYGTPNGQKKKGIFVGIEYPTNRQSRDRNTIFTTSNPFNSVETIPFTRFRNLIEVPRETEGPYLPSELGSDTENSFSTNAVRFYNVLPQNLKDKVKNSDIEEDRLRQHLANEALDNIPGLTNEVKEYLKGGKKSRRTKKSKTTKKCKTSKKSRKNKKRH